MSFWRWIGGSLLAALVALGAYLSAWPFVGPDIPLPAPAVPLTDLRVHSTPSGLRLESTASRPYQSVLVTLNATADDAGYQAGRPLLRPGAIVVLPWDEFVRRDTGRVFDAATLAVQTLTVEATHDGVRQRREVIK